MSGRKPDRPHQQSLAEAGLLAQQAAMAVLLAEMQALSALLPVHGNPPTDPALIEAQFDNLPV